MYNITDLSDSENSSELGGVTGTTKVEVLGYDELPSENMYSRLMGDDVASSSGSNVRSSLIGMGFHPSLVDKAIEQNGEDNVELLLETIFAYSTLQKSKPGSSDFANGHSQRSEARHRSHSESSDSLDSLFGDEKDTSSQANFPDVIHLKEEPDDCGDVHADKKASLLMMNFTLDEVEFAMDKLGEDAPVSELVDFIFAAQMAAADNSNHGHEEKTEEVNTETLFGTMDKTLHLLEIGFSEQEISAAIEKYGSEAPISELADSIVADRTGGICVKIEQYSSTTFSGLDDLFYKKLAAKTEESNRRAAAQLRDKELMERCNGAPIIDNDLMERFTGAPFRDNDLMERFNGKRPKEEYIDEPSNFKRPKQEFDDDLNSYSGSAWPEIRQGVSGPACTEARQGISKFLQRQLNHRAKRQNAVAVPKLTKPISCSSVDEMVAKAPLFFYGNVMNLSHDSWIKVSQFLYAIEPEFVNTQSFSALSRKEGYVHNLPTAGRFHILLKPPMTIEEAIPHVKKYWPSWDTRKQLSCISSETIGVPQICDRLGKVLIDSRGMLSVEKQNELLHQCRSLNLIWVGRNKLAPVDPEHIERILGYPLNHTQADGFSLAERLLSLKHCFQTDTLAYHLSVLKSLFPGGLTLLSIYSGVGGAEITLHRLGIHLKSVVSIEPSETKRKILKQWWNNSGQTGELVQIEDIQKLSSSRLDSLIKKFGVFDFIICQNPYTTSKHPTMPFAPEPVVSLDFSLFYEFVRVLQRVRSAIGR